MISELAEVGPVVGLFGVSLVLTAVSLWIAGKLTPWVMGERVEAPSVRSFFLQPMADTELDKARLVTLGIAAAILLSAMLAIACAVKFG